MAGGRKTRLFTAHDKWPKRAKMNNYGVLIIVNAPTNSLQEVSHL